VAQEGGVWYGRRCAEKEVGVDGDLVWRRRRRWRSDWMVAVEGATYVGCHRHRGGTEKQFLLLGEEVEAAPRR
jgi:hypothetical protein